METRYKTIDDPLFGCSFGGGVQTTAIMALQAMGLLAKPFDVFIFANVGEDSENPATLRYVDEHIKPFAQKHNITFIEVQKTYKGLPDTVRQSLMRDNKSVCIPAYFQGRDGTPKRALRSCTSDFKGLQVDKAIKSLGAKYAVLGIGFSIDEYYRVRTDFLDWRDVVNPRNPKSSKIGFWKKVAYPLIDMRLTRVDCHKIIAQAGLPSCPQSACPFCPHRTREGFANLHRTNPELFNQAVELEKHIIKKRGMYLTRSMRPLEDAINTEQGYMFDDDGGCDEGGCWV